MKRPSHLAKSRHGVYYFRLTIRTGAATQEKRWSLNTRDPADAKVKALYISAAMTEAKMSAVDVIALRRCGWASGIADLKAIILAVVSCLTCPPNAHPQIDSATAATPCTPSHRSVSVVSCRVEPVVANCSRPGASGRSGGSAVDRAGCCCRT
jgi:hypothetical protein